MSLILEKTLDTPYIQLEEGLVKMEGQLMPENILLFFKPVEQWVDNYLKNRPNLQRSI